MTTSDCLVADMGGAGLWTDRGAFMWEFADDQAYARAVAR
jgi:hypothetical protein